MVLTRAQRRPSHGDAPRDPCPCAAGGNAPCVQRGGAAFVADHGASRGDAGSSECQPLPAAGFKHFAKYQRCPPRPDPLPNRGPFRGALIRRSPARVQFPPTTVVEVAMDFYTPLMMTAVCLQKRLIGKNRCTVNLF
jgi:hypothetical protein